MTTRDIKFRIYNKERKKLYYCGDIYEMTDATGKNMRTYYNKDNCIFMQYTGLNDKNGKEIYEGDIVEYLQYDDGDYEAIVRKEVKYYAPYFSFGWTVKTYPNKDYLPKTPNPMDMEVIGNIYSNTELLTNQ